MNIVVHIGQTRVEVSFWFLALLALVTLADRSYVMPSLLGVIVLHEGAHTAVILACGARVRALRLRVYGCALDCDLSALTARQRAAVYLSAPALNLALGAACFLPNPSSIFGALNLCAGAFNLLPIPPLDGGNAAREAAVSARSHRALRVLALFALLAAAVAAAALAALKGNLTLLVCVLYLFFLFMNQP